MENPTKHIPKSTTSIFSPVQSLVSALKKQSQSLGTGSLAKTSHLLLRMKGVTKWEDQMESRGFGRLNPKNKLTLWYIWCSILWLRTTILIGKLLYHVQNQNICLGTGLIYFLWLSVFVAASVLVVHPIVKLNEFCVTFNIFVTFELRHRVEPLHGITNAVVALLFIQTSCIPIVLPLFCWIAPCAPQFIGSAFLIDPKTGECLATWFDKLVMYLLEAFCAIPVGGICAFFSCYAIYLTKSLNRFLMFIRKPKIIDFIRDKRLLKMTSMTYRAMLYRQTHLLVHLYHDCFQMQLLPNMLFSSSVIIIGCIFAIVELRNELPFVLYIAFPFILILTSLFLVVMLDMASNVIVLSKSIKAKWISQYIGKSHWFKLFAKSCPPLEIVAGPFSKIKRNRMATVIRYCLQRAIFLIVWSRKIRGLKLSSD